MIGFARARSGLGGDAALPGRRLSRMEDPVRSLLLAAAVEDELAVLLPRLRREGDCWRGTIGHTSIRARTLGVGPVEAALGAADALASPPGEPPADAAILLGTCGAFPGAGLSIGGAVLVERSLLTSSDAAAGLAYVPAPAAALSRSEEGLLRRLSDATGLRRVGCVTVAAITRDADHATALARHTECEVEHLEAHAFLRAAERARIPAACLLGVANDVGPDGHEQWRAHAEAASTAALAALDRFLRAPR